MDKIFDTTNTLPIRGRSRRGGMPRDSNFYIFMLNTGVFDHFMSRARVHGYLPPAPFIRFACRWSCFPDIFIKMSSKPNIEHVHIHTHYTVKNFSPQFRPRARINKYKPDHDVLKIMKTITLLRNFCFH